MYRHGMSHSPTYVSWASMMGRCYRSSNDRFRFYGAKGIRVTKKWHRFVGFLEDMGVRPEGMSLNRIDNTKGYSKKNCEWTTQYFQNRNYSRNRLITYRGKTYCLIDLAKAVGLKRTTLAHRLDYGWPIDRAVRPV